MQEIRHFRPSTVSRRFSVVAGFYKTCVIDGLRARLLVWIGGPGLRLVVPECPAPRGLRGGAARCGRVARRAVAADRLGGGR